MKRYKKEDNLDVVAGKKKNRNTQPLPHFFPRAFYSHHLEGVNKELRAVQPTEMPKEFIN